MSPAPTQAATPRPTPVVQRGATIYEVVNIRNGDYLYVHSGAGSTYPVVGRLAPGTSDISSTGVVVKNGDTPWLPISVGNLSGWVNADFLKPVRRAARIEDDPRYKSTDKRLNDIYAKVRRQMKSDQRRELKQQELEWLKHRDKLRDNPDAFFSETEQEIGRLERLLNPPAPPPSPAQPNNSN